MPSQHHSRRSAFIPMGGRDMESYYPSDFMDDGRMGHMFGATSRNAGTVAFGRHPQRHPHHDSPYSYRGFAGGDEWGEEELERDEEGHEGAEDDEGYYGEGQDDGEGFEEDFQQGEHQRRSNRNFPDFHHAADQGDRRRWNESASQGHHMHTGSRAGHQRSRSIDSSAYEGFYDAYYGGPRGYEWDPTAGIMGAGGAQRGLHGGMTMGHDPRGGDPWMSGIDPRMSMLPQRGRHGESMMPSDPRAGGVPGGGLGDPWFYGEIPQNVHGRRGRQSSRQGW